MGKRSSRVLTRFNRIAVLAIPAAFLAAGFYRAAPFVDDVTEALAGGDDWWAYKVYALSILNDGFSIPSVVGPYRRPGGFLYNYFVAAAFAAMGVNASYIYVLQSVMLGISIVVMYLAFRRYLTPQAGAAFLVLAPLFLAVDMYRYYVFRLLSENLFIFLLPLLFWLTLAAWERASFTFAALAGAVGGLALLTRPNAALILPAICVLFVVYGAKRSRRGITHAAACALVFAAVAALMPIRNYVATGWATFDMVTDPLDWVTVRYEPYQITVVSRLAETIRHYGERVGYVAGIGPILNPDARVRVHWLIMWSGFLTFAVAAFRRRALDFWQSLLVVFTAVYLGPLVAVGGIHSYGYRLIVPAIPSVLLLAIVGCEPIVTQWLRRFTERRETVQLTA